MDKQCYQSLNEFFFCVSVSYILGKGDFNRNHALREMGQNKENKMPDFEFDSAKKGTSESTDKVSLSDDEILDLIDIVKEGDAPDELDVSKTNDMPFNEAKAGEELDKPALEKISSETDKLSLDEELDTTASLEADIDASLDDIDTLSETDALLNSEPLDLVDASEETSASELENIALDSDELSLDEELDTTASLEADIDASLDDIDTLSETDALLNPEPLDFVDAPEETSASELENIALDSDELSLDEELDTAASLEFNVDESLESIEASQNDNIFTVSGHEQKLSGISEERIEALITKTVRDVVEKVARETMTTVAEKLINDAIEALKQTIEPSDS
jgi:hypothetical protein